MAVTHEINAGFAGVGKLFDPFLRFYLNRRFERDLEDHANIEFTKLAEILSESIKEKWFRRLDLTRRVMEPTKVQVLSERGLVGQTE